MGATAALFLVGVLLLNVVRSNHDALPFAYATEACVGNHGRRIRPIAHVKTTIIRNKTIIPASIVATNQNLGWIEGMGFVMVVVITIDSSSIVVAKP